ncbi:Centromere/kinetochore Zw10-domain-containing protein, partial [Spinellus fusiger]
LDGIHCMIEFFFLYFLEKREQHARLLGSTLLPQLFELLIVKVMSTAVPSNSAELKDFDRISAAAKDIEQACIHTYGMLLDTVDYSYSLVDYVSHLDSHFAKKRSNAVLKQGRNVMLRRLYDIEEAQETDISSQKNHTTATGITCYYQITQTPQLLILLLTDILEEASSLSHSHLLSTSKLMDTFFDLLDLYRAIMPTYHCQHFMSQSANSLVFYNDCSWLSHQLLCIEISRHPCMDAKRLTKAAHQLKTLGRLWYDFSLRQCMHHINPLFTSLDGFVSIASQKQQQVCDEAIGGIVRQVRLFAANTNAVVDKALFIEMMGSLVDTIICLLIRMVEDMTDIGADESTLIARALNSLAQLVSVFDVPGKDATDSDVIQVVPHWQKFWLLKDMLEMSMRDITEAYRRHTLVMFSTDELVGLICALFANTERREEFLKEI